MLSPVQPLRAERERKEKNSVGTELELGQRDLARVDKKTKLAMTCRTAYGGTGNGVDEGQRVKPVRETARPLSARSPPDAAGRENARKKQRAGRISR